MSNILSSISETYMVEGEKWFPHVCAHVHKTGHILFDYLFMYLFILFGSHPGCVFLEPMCYFSGAQCYFRTIEGFAYLLSPVSCVATRQRRAWNH